MAQIVKGTEHKTTYVTISLDEYESMKSTIEVLSDPELMGQLKKSKEDIKLGRTKPLAELLKEANKAKR